MAVAPTSDQWIPGGYNAELGYIRQQAATYNLDPEAVLAVAAHEGVTLPSQVGDSGTSYGPWQLHLGGSLPPAVYNRGAPYAEQWANSPAGINFALQQMSAVAAGQQANQAIQTIVTDFERPADPSGEIAAAEQTYGTGGVPRQLTAAEAQQIPGATTHGGIMSATANAAGTLFNTGLGPVLNALGINAGQVGLPNQPNLQTQAGKSVVSSLGLTGFVKELWQLVTLYYLRVLEVIAGGLLIIVSLFLLARGGVPSPV